MICQRCAKTIGQLVNIIGGVQPEDSSEIGPVTEVINLWDGRTVIAAYSDNKRVDAQSDKGFFVDSSVLLDPVKELLSTGKPFVTQTVTDEEVCMLEWMITVSPPEKPATTFVV